ncbi:glycoprotease family-domain-containing protein [Zychaea mexicana]|uniref:glycoprotease family-domain-containing protein n=1 Tax=Zychaea mexicana TaxID=64656 RepID=UPI0022FF2D23|nr:glycoprotease family-domain-containing protein [Zychaea mexicana]KAI9498485.1 glycoprotease family-domain-containing protein [Zychaea mexicana]
MLSLLRRSKGGNTLWRQYLFTIPATRTVEKRTRLYATKVVLGIETSCDDTSAAIVTSDRTILSEVVKSQQEMHEPMGGIVPTLASLGHSRHLPSVICETLDRAKLTIADIDAIAVTRGPGLPPCLPVGLNAAKTLAAVSKKPLIGVHHMEAHALTARLTTPTPFPFMTLLISGGHTLLLTANGLGDYDQLGTTLDTAVGEAIDKTARALELEWNGSSPGPALERAAAKGDPDRFQLPTPMLQRNKSVIAFSFSGLKTSVARLAQEQIKTPQDTCDVAAAFQMTCIRHIEQKLKLALHQEMTMNKKPLTALVVMCPPPKLCTDNGVMIAWAGLERFQAGLTDDYTITTLPKWPIESLKERSSS